jgi:hypothetical protein
LMKLVMVFSRGWGTSDSGCSVACIHMHDACMSVSKLAMV